MSRELEFRAWQNGNKEMVYFRNEKMKHDIYQQRHFCNLLSDGKLEQYTGLKDKNGVKIFEGDIVKEGNKILTITHRWGCFFFSSKKDNLKPMNKYACDFHSAINQYVFVEKIQVSDAINLNQFSKIEIIGNIHTNPELLS